MSRTMEEIRKDEAPRWPGTRLTEEELAELQAAREAKLAARGTPLQDLFSEGRGLLSKWFSPKEDNRVIPGSKPPLYQIPDRPEQVQWAIGPNTATETVEDELDNIARNLVQEKRNLEQQETLDKIRGKDTSNLDKVYQTNKEQQKDIKEEKSARDSSVLGPGGYGALASGDGTEVPKTYNNEGEIVPQTEQIPGINADIPATLGPGGYQEAADIMYGAPPSAVDITIEDEDDDYFKQAMNPLNPIYQAYQYELLGKNRR
tara:strand:- start:5654 stop:6433 length:780 start_codon:yes stop_codon:yes gene_type:complete